MRIFLTRWAYTPLGTFGTLQVGDWQCYTVEKRWVNDEPQVSCIPIGIYDLRLSMSPHLKYECYEVLNVPQRSSIRIHKANRAAELLGCIAVGTKLGVVLEHADEWAVLDSLTAFTGLMSRLAIHQDNSIQIANAMPGGVFNGPTQASILQGRQAA